MSVVSWGISFVTSEIVARTFSFDAPNCAESPRALVANTAGEPNSTYGDAAGAER
jgi:hypothetical protein